MKTKDQLRTEIHDHCTEIRKHVLKIRPLLRQFNGRASYPNERLNQSIITISYAIEDTIQDPTVSP